MVLKLTWVNRSIFLLSYFCFSPFFAPCIAEDTHDKAATEKVELKVVGAGFDKPVQIILSTEEKPKLYVVEQKGLIVPAANEGKVGAALINISEQTAYTEGDGGLLGAAFHPKFSENNKILVHYVVLKQQLEQRISEITLLGSSDNVDERALIRYVHPHAGHYGGHVQFGADGNLYVGIGDGGGDADPDERGQSTNDIFGSILRINPEENQGAPYLAPIDNPFVGNKSANKDIYAYGFRNPRTFSFDKLTQALWLGDSGSGLSQEINLVRRGGNYGWSVYDGMDCLRMKFECLDKSYLLPVHAYGKKEGNSVTAGFVYRGTKLRSLIGKFLFSDRSNGKIWALEGKSNPNIKLQLLLESKRMISSFGEDEEGELYAADYQSGEILKITGREPELAPQKPALTQTESGIEAKTP